MSRSYCLTSLTFLNAFICMKCFSAYSAEYSCHSHSLYAFSRVRWSDSGTKNFSQAAFASDSQSLGVKKTVGIDNIEIMVKISAEHLYSSLKMSILLNGGSTGNSTIFLPISVRSPVLDKAPSIQSWYIAFKIVS